MLDERTRRLLAASEALVLPYGGVSRVHRACGLSRNAIAKGIREIQSGTALEAGRVRRRGAGRKPITVQDPQLVIALDRLVEPDTLGDPESPLRWVCKSTRVLAAELGRQRHPVSHVKLGTDQDTAAFAVASIRGWWRAEGRRLYGKARSILITADAGGSNGSRLRLWKWELQKLADETARTLSVCHFPPGTSKWNKVE